MLELSFHSDRDESIHSADIARSQRIPEKFLELILVELRRAGLVTSQRGPEGGHRLARAPKDITIGEIWRAIEGPLTAPPARGRNKGVGDPFRDVWADADKAVSGVVDQVTLEDVRARVQPLHEVPDYNI
jgi:Rrf2 family protein